MPCVWKYSFAWDSETLASESEAAKIVLGGCPFFKAGLVPRDEYGL